MFGSIWISFLDAFPSLFIFISIFALYQFLSLTEISLKYGVLLSHSQITGRTSIFLTNFSSYASTGHNLYNRLYFSLWVAEYLNIKRGFKACIASFDLAVLSTLWGSSIITIGFVCVIKSIGLFHWSLSDSLNIRFDLVSFHFCVSSTHFLKASILIIITSIVSLSAKSLAWLGFEELYLKKLQFIQS